LGALTGHVNNRAQLTRSDYAQRGDGVITWIGVLQS